MCRTLSALCVALALTACGTLSVDSYRGTGLEERIVNCAVDIIDPVIRGAACR